MFTVLLSIRILTIYNNYGINSPDKILLRLLICTVILIDAATLRISSGCAGPSFSLTLNVDLLNDRIVTIFKIKLTLNLINKYVAVKVLRGT